MDSGELLPFDTFSIRSPSGAISQLSATTFRLQPGVYHVTFVTDASADCRRTDIGAALQIVSGTVHHAAALQSSEGDGQERLALNTILTPTGDDTLSVVNNSGDTVHYERSSLSVVKLA